MSRTPSSSISITATPGSRVLIRWWKKQLRFHFFLEIALTYIETEIPLQNPADISCYHRGNLICSSEGHFSVKTSDQDLLQRYFTVSQHTFRRHWSWAIKRWWFHRVFLLGSLWFEFGSSVPSSLPLWWGWDQLLGTVCSLCDHICCIHLKSYIRTFSDCKSSTHMWNVSNIHVLACKQLTERMYNQILAHKSSRNKTVTKNYRENLKYRPFEPKPMYDLNLKPIHKNKKNTQIYQNSNNYAKNGPWSQTFCILKGGSSSC